MKRPAMPLNLTELNKLIVECEVAIQALESGIEKRPVTFADVEREKGYFLAARWLATKSLLMDANNEREALIKWKKSI